MRTFFLLVGKAFGLCRHVAYYRDMKPARYVVSVSVAKRHRCTGAVQLADGDERDGDAARKGPPRGNLKLDTCVTVSHRGVVNGEGHSVAQLILPGTRTLFKCLDEGERQELGLTREDRINTKLINETTLVHYCNCTQTFTA